MGTDRTSLGDRMKNYEQLSDLNLMSRLPIAIRLDGKGFSRLTKQLHLDKPFDRWFMNAMASTMVYVASKVQGCVLGYTQSDEITLVLINGRDAEPYFANRVQKIVSVTASMAAAAFNSALWERTRDIHAHFDSRVFALPSVTEVVNCLIWRQQDCIRNSIQSAAYYEVGRKVGRKTTHKMMRRLNTKMLQVVTENGVAIRNKWVDEPALVFQSEPGREWLRDVGKVRDPEEEFDDVVNQVEDIPEEQ